jgi:hypothetical protein
VADEVQRTVLQIRDDRGWLNVAVIDGRRYPGRQRYDRAVGRIENAGRH